MHVPVLLEEVIESLALEKATCFVDATLDGGGHSRAIAERFPNLAMIGVEYDPVEYAQFREHNPDLLERIAVHNASYEQLPEILGQTKPDAILMDLGVSSWHYEASGRGFSFQRTEPLDMRFNPERSELTAVTIVNTWSEDEIERILREYGEEIHAAKIAQGIVRARREQVIATTDELVAVIKAAVPSWYLHKRLNPATKTFQALRIAVNDELGTVARGIRNAISVLAPEGRLAVISFHGLEDIIVRREFDAATEQGLARWLLRRTIRPTWKEMQANPRSRSAKMKVLRRISFL